MGEGGPTDGGHESARRVERSGGASIGCLHEGLERFAQHFGIDRGFGPVRGLFAWRESVPRQQFSEDDAEYIVGEAKEGAAACARRRVEGAEEEGEEGSAVEVAAAFHAAGEDVMQESPIVVEPAFCLDETEEEESGDVE